MSKEKIVITGGLGYVGTELCKVYSGEARYKDIVVLDSRFISERVKQLRDWGISFVQGSILDEVLLKEILSGATIIYHLAGITDVAYVKTQENETKDKEIKEIGIDGTRNILKNCPKGCKLIFPSTHVVFEGLEDTKFDITEDEIPKPVLTYSLGKVQSEQDIIGSGLTYIITRFGSVYGYSTDTMRINIMPNLFSKITSQSGVINIFSGGVQYKSLINVIDVVRGMKFLAESKVAREIYHLSNENMTVKEVADICKEINPKINIVITEDEIPNLGYTLSNKKLISTGFKFLYNIKDSIKEMVDNWSEKEQPKDLEYIIRGDKEYIDSRGKISNYELPEPINLIGYIESKKGSVRANHYHPIQEQKCLLISGRYISVIKDLSDPNSKIEIKTINPGDIAVIKPNVAHAMVFLEDSIFLNLVRGEREHENYGITHTIPYLLVDEDMRLSLLKNYKYECRSCGNKNLKTVISLGDSPLANNLIDNIGDCEKYPLNMLWCPNCNNCQLSYVVPPDKLFDNYLYVSSTSKSFKEHFEKAAINYIDEFNLTKDSLVVDIGSNDGIFLKPLQDRGIKVVGVEPAKNVSKISEENGIPTINAYFNDASALEVFKQFGSPDLITASNMFAHSDELVNITNQVFALLKESGVFIIEVQYILDTIKDLTFDNIYHEHVNYWSVTSLVNFFNNLGFSVYKVQHIDTHGGSIRVYVNRDNSNIDESVHEFLDKEEYIITNYSTFLTFSERVNQLKKTVRKNIKLLKQKYNKIAAYGSPAKATTALNYFEIDNTYIEYTIEDNKLKHGKYIPGVNIPIYSKEQAIDNLPEVIIVLAWNYFEEIKSKNADLIDKGVKFISIKDLEIPDMPILDISILDGIDKPGKVYDCFLFFNELDLLDLRLNILDGIVDYFVICEASVTHSGEPRDFCFEQNKDRFSKFLDKIIYLKVDIPQDFTDLQDQSNFPEWDKIVDRINTTTLFRKEETVHGREFFQREIIITSLRDCKDEDVIMLSDIDEIPNPDTLVYILENFNDNRVYGLRQNSYYYKLNLLKESHWVGPRLSSYKIFKDISVNTFRHTRDILIANGGWHFSFQGTADQVKEKILSYSHCDMGTPEVIDSIEDKINNFIDPYNRGPKLKLVSIDNTYPKYLLDNIDKFKHMTI